MTLNKPIPTITEDLTLFTVHRHRDWLERERQKEIARRLVLWILLCVAFAAINVILWR
jgi:hypothetical protein